jgi:hypothetical protein
MGAAPAPGRSSPAYSTQLENSFADRCSFRFSAEWQRGHYSQTRLNFGLIGPIETDSLLQRMLRKRLNQ